MFDFCLKAQDTGFLKSETNADAFLKSELNAYSFITAKAQDAPPRTH